MGGACRRRWGGVSGTGVVGERRVCLVGGALDDQLLCIQAVVSSLSSVLQGFMMSGIVGVVFPDLQNSLLQVFVELDPPNSRVCC